MGNMKIPSQEQIVLNHLKKYGSITAREASRKYDIDRLSGRIFNLRKKHDIVTVTEPNKRRGTHARYVYKGEKDVQM